MAFYRTYRPQIIAQIDNIAVRDQLLGLLSKDIKNLPHAFMLTGPKGTGKTTSARLLAKLFTCLHLSKKTGPCGSCETCTSIADGNYMDVLEIDAASNRGIDEVRQLRERIGLLPSQGIYKIYIIDEVHMMTTEAFNALLKTLEEPPAHAIFILATTDVHKVPATILSRCMQITFHRAGKDELREVLTRIAKEEKIAIDDDALVQIAEFADGSFRDGAKLLEQVSFQKGAITAKMVSNVLARTDDGLRQHFLHDLAIGDVQAALGDIADCVREGREIKSFVVDILTDLEKMLVETVTGKAVHAWKKEQLQDAIVKFTRSYEELRYSPIPQLPLELAVIELCQHTPKTEVKQDIVINPPEEKLVPAATLGLITIEKLLEHWSDFILTTKPLNHSVAAVLRSSRPKAVDGGIVTIEAYYKFHLEKLAESKTKQILADVLKKLFGESVKVEIVLGKK